ncbi:MAG: DUF4430 domain-containing protein [Firmicutes bacterium]|nr:DUF4430 domain-containing protein [Bacillota bacterium]
MGSERHSRIRGAGLALVVILALFFFGACGSAQTSSGTDAPASGPSCTVSISCATILDNMELCDPSKVDLIPDDGWILKPVSAEFSEGETVFDVLKRVCRENEIHLEFTITPAYNSVYVEGIANIYEFDAGALSGWMYDVNGWFPNYSCSVCGLKDGDVVRFVYTCDLGADVGGGGVDQTEGGGEDAEH